MQNDDVDEEEDEDVRARGEPFPSPPLASTQADFTDQWVSQAAKATESGTVPILPTFPFCLVGTRYRVVP